MSSFTGDASQRLTRELVALRHRVQAAKTALPKALKGSGDSVSGDTINRIENGTHVSEQSVLTYVHACQRIAEEKKLPINPARFDRGYWSRVWKDGDAAPPFDLRYERSNSVPVVAGNEPASLPEPNTNGMVGGAASSRALSEPVAKPVCEWSAEALRVHATVGGTRMIDYVPRPHDTEVRGALDQALAGSGSRMIVLRGGSCTGKTRTAIEALLDRIPHWSLLRPTGAAQLRHVLKTDQATSTVIWLDEIQAFLSDGDGDHIAERLFEVLTSDRDVVAIGTVWGGADFVEWLDLAPEVKRFFDHDVELIDVPSSFSKPEIKHARQTLGPELAEVIDAAAASGELIQNLAGGPQLVKMYTHPHDAYLAAVLTAAMDLFRIGHTLPIPSTMLNEAAFHYLGQRRQHTRPSDWFEAAIRQAAKPIKQAVSALEPARTTIEGDALDGFVLADFLGYHGKRHRSEPPHQRLWAIVAAHAVNHAAARAVALEAGRQGLHSVAERLHRRSIELGFIGGWADLARQGAERRDLSNADELITVARADLGVAHGYPGFLWYEIALLYYAANDRTTAEEMLRNANEVFIDWSTVTKARERLGDSAGADDAARKDCERQGFPTAWYEYLIPSRAASGDLVGAERAAEDMFAAGWAYGWVEIGNKLMFKGDYRGAAQAFQTAAERGIENVWQDAGRALALLGEHAAAEQAMLRTALSPNVDEPQYAWAELAALRHSLGDTAGAEAAAENGEGMAWARLASERAKQGQFESAKTAAAIAAGLGDGTGWADLAGTYELAGFPEEAELAARASAPLEYSIPLFGGGPSGWRQIIRQRCEREDWEAVERACREYRKVDEEYVQRVLATHEAPDDWLL
ncbi:hypothetical protein ACFXHA_33285 [Nocardia sp. NPDC059240]|uniref:hypothetical protein n=1 Tax=Nocardia sp. NPDC059240 TaxID=3346786 RepID=UPI0036A73030